MSQRTVIEINHDRLEIFEDRHFMEILVQELQSGDTRLLQAGCIPGLRILGTRHHSETLNLEVK